MTIDYIFCSYMLLLLVGAFVVVYFVTPKIISIVEYKQLMDQPNKRSSHTMMVPNLGGISFYIVLVLGLFFLQQWDNQNIAMSLMPGLLILFMVGIKDDLVILAPLSKILAQTLAITFLLLNPAFHIHELNGFLGVYSVNILISIPLSAFIMLTIINAFNLIDGIDGLASTIAIIIFSLLGAMFCWLGMYFFTGVSIIMIGSLLAFLRYNLSTKKKIFMGDTGSMIIGFIIAVCVIRLFAIPQSILKGLPIQLENLPLIVMAILIVPFFDTARVFTIRIMNKKKPFAPDRNHIHHLLIDLLKLSHRRASFLIGAVNFLFVLVFLSLGAVISNWKLLVVFIVLTVLITYLFYRNTMLFKKRRKIIIKRQRRKLKQKKN